MKIIFLEAPYQGKAELCREALDYLKDYLKKKEYKKIGLYASAQFATHLDKIKSQLKDNKIAFATSKPDRAHAEGQLLGCNVYENSLNLNEEVDCYLYIGDGRFHPLALVIAQKDKKIKEIKEVLCYDPLQKKISVISFEEVKMTLKKCKAALMKFLSSGNIGVIISVKPGQEHFKAGLKLEKKYPAKKFYYFVDDNFSFGQLENFPFIDEWVNAACPRIGFDEQEKFLKGVVNLNDALRAEKILKVNSF